MSDPVISGDERWRVDHGDSLGWLTSLPAACTDAIITDPPYSSGGMHRADRAGKTSDKYFRRDGAAANMPAFSGDNRDQRGFLLWCSLWLAEALRATKPGGVIAQFCDWRQLPVTADALQAGGWVWRGVAAWDKGFGGRGSRPQMGRLGAQCEYIVWGSKGPLDEGRGVGCLPGLFSHLSPREGRLHATEKPLGLMLEIVELCAPGGLVVDPFAGSATTGVAAIRTGRRFLGCEIETTYLDVGRERLRAEASGLDMSAAKAGQAGLFRSNDTADLIVSFSTGRRTHPASEYAMHHVNDARALPSGQRYTFALESDLSTGRVAS